jgi:hypothetical protein
MAEFYKKSKILNRHLLMLIGHASWNFSLLAY